jgi:hypothetical protein
LTGEEVKLMRVIENRTERLVMTSNPGKRAAGAFLIVIPVIILVAFPSVFFGHTPWGFFDVFFLVVPLAAIYFGIRMLVGRRIVFEKFTNSVTLEAPGLLLVRQKRVIPFAEVDGVEITGRRKWTQTTGVGSYRGVSYSGGAYTGGSHLVWHVSLDTGGEMVMLDTGKREDMSHLAHKISGFMGKKLVSNSG